MTLEQQINEVIEKATRELSAQIETHLGSLSSEIGQAAAADRVSVVRDLRMAADAEIARRSQEAVAASEADGACRLEEAMAAARAEGDRRTEEAVGALKGEMARRIDEGIASAHVEHARQLEAAVAAAQSEVSLRVEEAVGAATSDGERTLADALARARADGDRQMAEALDATRQEAADQIQRSRVEALAAERQGELEQLERLLDAVRRLDGARSLSEVLDVLAESSAKEAPRVAVFLVRASWLQGWRFAGLGADHDPGQMKVALDQAGLVTRALRAGRAFATSELGGEVAITPFGALPTDCAGLAVPIRVGGETVAVVYADNAGVAHKEVPSAWPEVVEMLARHAARCLEVVTVAKVSQSSAPVPEAAPSPRYAPHTRSFQATGDEDDDAARRYARLLVSEIKLYNEAAVAQGRRDHNLAERLRPEIERARKLYEERVPASARARTDHFGLELVRTLASGDASLLGAR